MFSYSIQSPPYKEYNPNWEGHRGLLLAQIKMDSVMHLTERVITDKGLCSKDQGTKKFSRSGGEGAFPTPRDDSCPERRKAADGHVAGKIQQPHKWARLVRNGWDWNQRSTHICLGLSGRFSRISSPGWHWLVFQCHSRAPLFSVVCACSQSPGCTGFVSVH